MKPKLTKLMSLNHERHYAYLVARMLAGHGYEGAGAIITSFGNEGIPRFLGLVADAWKGKPSKFDVTPTGLAIIEAWSTAYHLAGSKGKGKPFNIDAVPTLPEIKTQYAITKGKKPPTDQAEKRHWIADLEHRKQIPSDQTFRKTLDRSKLPYR